MSSSALCSDFDYAREPWQRYGADKSWRQLAHAWCLPAKYVAEGWAKGARGIPLAKHDCHYCGHPMTGQPHGRPRATRRSAR